MSFRFVRQRALYNRNVLEKREAQLQAYSSIRQMSMQELYLLSLLPGDLRRWLTKEFHLDVELLTSLQLMTLQETVAVNSRLNCNTFSLRCQHREQLSVQTKEKQNRNITNIYFVRQLLSCGRH